MHIHVKEYLFFVIELLLTKPFSVFLKHLLFDCILSCRKQLEIWGLEIIQLEDVKC